MNKQIVKQTMLSLEARDLESAREKYLEYVGNAGLDRSEPTEDDEQAQAELASDLSEAFDNNVHSHSDKIEKLAAMDFGIRSALAAFAHTFVCTLRASPLRLATPPALVAQSCAQAAHAIDLAGKSDLDRVLVPQPPLRGIMAHTPQPKTGFPGPGFLLAGHETIDCSLGASPEARPRYPAPSHTMNGSSAKRSTT